ncbi:hypothetical protein ACOBQX_21815 [Actinokineospora sp. G85]|uniref:hypothetical protein n=1 Tax=Actinokineospora sp. G85 TaxID=3406626 RepID=UPI003C7712CA
MDLTLVVDGEGQTPATLDKLVDSLAADLRAARVGVVTRGTQAPAGGSKSGIAQVLGELAVTGTVPGSLLIAHRTIVAFLNRAAAKSVTVEVNGKKVTITGATAEETAEALRVAAEPPAEPGA